MEANYLHDGPRRGNVQPQYGMIHYQTPPVAIKLGHCCRLFRKYHDPQDVDREVALRVGPRLTAPPPGFPGLLQGLFVDLLVDYVAVTSQL